MTRETIVTLAVLGVAAQLIALLLLTAGGVALAGVRGPLRWLRRAVWGYELWIVFVVASVATAGSLFFSEVAGFFPCELCWYQRICMYPLTIIVLVAALANDHRVARYLLPLPIVGAAVSAYHLLVENQIVGQSRGCFLSAPGGCATKWIEEFGYVTIPTLALSAFLLGAVFLLFASLDGGAVRSELG